ncbi:MAG TPA: hypothetical protein VIV62_03855 [Chthoniobacterales bacterium]|jgi:BMFP domain-containing protein YqiC
MLLNEFLKARRKIDNLEQKVASLTAQLKEQAAQIQQVNEKVELAKAAPQFVDNKY